MRLSIVAASLLAAFAAVPAFAAEPASPITGNFTFANNYFYRGLTQTDDKPALQGGLDYAHDSGFYLGTWGSNVSWLDSSGKSSMEWDVYTGYKFSAAGLDFNFGALQYFYPGSKVAGETSADTLELNAAVGYKWVTAKVSYSTTNLFGAANSKGSLYPELGASVDLGAGFTGVASVGRTIFGNDAGIDYNDYKLGVTKEISGLTLGAYFVDTDVTKPRGLVTLSKSF